MHKCLVLVRNILGQDEVSEEVSLCLEDVNELMDDTLDALKEGDLV